ncbi:MAG: hypothetical protein JWO67_1277 [Streptosporangiaceae bacterium]|nr:hypothetical protein [Streptosporangiaceae bacterium]
MSFDAAAIKSLFSEVTSHASALNLFADVNGHAPESPPGHGASYAVWLSGITPLPKVSGLASTSGRVEFTGHIYTKMRARPLSGVDPAVMLLASDLIGAYSADFTLGGTVMTVDLLGAYGTPLQGAAAFADFQGTPLRVMEMTLPIVLDDLWDQES